MSLATALARHRRSIVAIAGALTLAGIVAGVSLPIGLFPQVSFPRVVVDLASGDRPAAQTTLAVTRPVEEAIRTVPGVREVRSATSRGSAQVAVDFGWGRDMIATTLLVDAAVSQILSTLPAGTTYTVRRMDPTVFPIISYSLTSERLSPAALRDLAQFEIVPRLASVPGLARVGVQGGAIDEVEVLADVHRLDATGLGLADLVKAIGEGNPLQAVGRVQDHDRLYLAVASTGVHDLDGLRNLVLRSEPSGEVRLRDVADVVDGAVPQWVQVSADGRPAVLFNVYEQPDGNAVRIAAEVRERLAGFALPPGVRLSNWYDQSILVTDSAASVRDAVIIGLILAGGVLLLFLRDWRLTLVALLAVPTTLAATVLLLGLFGMSFNIMTLGGLAAAVGLVVDDVIVMVEHLSRRDAGGADDSIAAAREFWRPLTGSSIATLIVFLPLAILDGVTGAFSKALAITMACALVISWLMAACVVPVLAGVFIDPTHRAAGASLPPSRVARRHGALLEQVLRRPWILALGVAALAALGAVAFTRVPSGFMPRVDEGGFVMDFYTRPGTSLAETNREVAQVESLLRAMPDVETFSRRTGTGLGGDLGEAHHGDFFVRLKPAHRVATEDMMADVLDRAAREVPGVQLELAQLMEDLIGDLTAVPQPVEIKLFGVDPAQLVVQARAVAAAIGGIAGLVEVKDGVMLAGDGIDVRIDPAKTAPEGVSAQDVSAAVDTALNGSIATQLPRTTKLVGVRVRIPGALTLRDSGLADLPIRAPDGHLFPLARVATLVPVSGEAEVSRDDLQPMEAVTARIDSRGMGAVMHDVRRVLDQGHVLAPGVRYELGGLYSQQQAAFAGLAKVFAAALVAELVLLLVLYENLWLPLIVAITALLSTSAVFTALWMTGVELNITAVMGMTMVIGIATEMSIFYLSEYTGLAQEHTPREALRLASISRLRPIAMTTLAAVLTLLPLALAIGHGSAIQQPLAIAIIAGMVVQVPLVLIAMPVMIGWTLPRENA